MSMSPIWQQYGHILRKGHSNPATAPDASLITLLTIFTGLVIASLSTLRCLEGQMLFSRCGDYNTKISHNLLRFLTRMQGIGGSDLRQMTFKGYLTPIATQMFVWHSFGPKLGDVGPGYAVRRGVHECCKRLCPSLSRSIVKSKDEGMQ